MKSNELRVGNIVRQPTTECALKYKEYSIQIAHLLFADMLNPVPITKEWLIKLGAKEQIVCHTCAKINTSKLCYKGQDCGDTQFQRQAEINGLYSDCKELKEKTGHFDLFGFNLFKGKTIQHWSREDSWNFTNLSWNLNLTVNYVHELQNLYFALTGKELEFFTDKNN